jgi:hypothetical protein
MLPRNTMCRLAVAILSPWLAGCMETTLPATAGEPNTAVVSRNQMEVETQPSVDGEKSGVNHAVADAVRLLPFDCESLVVAARPFLILGRDDLRTADLKATLSHVPMLAGLAGVDDGSAWEKLVGERLVFCVQASERFREPPAQGAVRFAGAVVIAPAGDALGVERWLKKLTPHSVGRLTVEGVDVVLLKAPSSQEGHFSMLYVARAGDNLLVIANDEDYLSHVVIESRKVKHPLKALDKIIPQLEFVEMDSAFWAVRRYSTTPGKDRTSPYFRRGEDEPVIPNDFDDHVPDYQAGAFVYSLDDDGSRQKIIYFSENERAAAIARRAWTYTPGHGDISAATKLLKAGVVEATVVTDSEDSRQTFLMVLWIRLGHSFY